MYFSYAKVLIDFDENPPFELVSNTPLTVVGNYKSTAGRFGSAFQMTSDTYCDINALNSLTNQFIIGFWLQSTNPGVVTSPSQTTVPLKMALLNKSNLSYSSITNLTTASSEMFCIWEETQSDGTNKLKVRVSGATSATLQSSSYSVATRHHFLIAYLGSSGILAVYIDGSLDIGSITSGIVPTTMNMSTSPFAINLGVDGYGYQTSRNFGSIDDLFVFSQYDVLSSDIFKAIDLGAVYISDSTLYNQDEVSLGTIFNDTSTIQINAICGSKGNVYIGDSSGNLSKGIRTIWESRRDFANEDMKLLPTVIRSETDNLSVNNGILNITNAIIKV